ncbi:MAG: hypothetical protein V7K40_16905 [Nostoc sp.]
MIKTITQKWLTNLHQVLYNIGKLPPALLVWLSASAICLAAHSFTRHIQLREYI